MKPFIFTICLLLSFLTTSKAQDSEELSKLNPCSPPLTKEKLKKQKEFQKHVIIDYIDFEPIEIFVGIEPKILSSGKIVGIIKFQTTSFELTFTNTTESQLLITKLNFFIRITSIDKKFDGCFEEKVRLHFKEEEVKKKIPIFYQKIFELPKGIYTLVFLIRDIETGKTGIQKIKFEIK